MKILAQDPSPWRGLTTRVVSGNWNSQTIPILVKAVPCAYTVWDNVIYAAHLFSFRRLGLQHALGRGAYATSPQEKPWGLDL